MSRHNVLERNVAMDLFQHLNSTISTQKMPTRHLRQFQGRYKGQRGAIIPQPLGGRGPMNRKYHAPTAGIRTRPMSSMSVADHNQINHQLHRVGTSLER